MSATAIDALPYQSALLDRNGIVVAVNEGWRTFAEENGGGRQLRDGVGIDYLSVCRAARGSSAEEGRLAAAAIVDALTGRPTLSTFRYPCHSPTLQRWFVCATSIHTADPHRGVLVSHIGLSERPQSARSAPRSETGASLAVSANPLLDHLQQIAVAGCWRADPSLGSITLTQEAHRILETSSGAITLSLEALISLFALNDRRLLESFFLQLAHFGAAFDVDLPLATMHRNTILVHITGRAETVGVKVTQLYGVIQDLTGNQARRLHFVE